MNMFSEFATLAFDFWINLKRKIENAVSDARTRGDTVNTRVFVSMKLVRFGLSLLTTL